MPVCYAMYRIHVYSVQQAIINLLFRLMTHASHVQWDVLIVNPIPIAHRVHLVIIFKVQIIRALGVQEYAPHVWHLLLTVYHV